MDNTKHTHLQPPLPSLRKRASSGALDGSPVLKSPRLGPRGDDECTIPKESEEGGSQVLTLTEVDAQKQLKNWKREKRPTDVRREIRLRRHQGWCCECTQQVKLVDDKCFQCDHCTFTCILCLATRTEDKKNKSATIEFGGI